MKILNFLKIAFLAGFIFGFMSVEMALAATHFLDGDLGDWGVTPFTNWLPNSPDIDYVVENNYNRLWSDAFSEKYDIEAMYFDDDINNIYFAIISSNPYTNDWAHESLFFDFSGRTANDILLSETNGYKYAADLCPVELNTLNTRNIYLVNQSKVFEENHHNGSPYHFPVSVAITGYQKYDGLKWHNYIGSYQVYNKSINGIENGKGPTYVLEGSISKSYFPGECTQPIEMYYSRVTCIKDWVTLRGDKDNPCVPEPATLLLFGSGLLGAGIFRRRKR